MSEKICKICKIIKLESEYFFCKRRNVFYSHCKKCNTERGKINKNKRKDDYNKKRREGRHKYKDQEVVYRKKYYEEKIKPKNKNIIRVKKIKVKKERKLLTDEERKQYHIDYRERNREKKRLQAIKYRSENKEEINLRRIERNKLLPQYKKIRHNLRVNMRRCIKNNKDHSFELVGCSIQFVRDYLESKFTKGMTWENYGVRGWHIDHIRPCSSFDLSDREQQKMCFHYTNLQPLWATRSIAMSYGEDSSYVGNLEKGDRII